MAIVLESGVTRRMRPRGLLLQAISTFDATQLGDSNPYRWLSGVSFLPRLCSGLNIVSLDPCAGGWGEITPPSNCQPWVTQMPFQMVDALQGKALSFTIADLDQLLQERETELRSYAFAKALVGPVITSGTHTLSESAHNPSTLFGAAAVSVTQAIAVLEMDLADTLHGVQGIIHVPPSMLHQIAMKAMAIRNGDHWETPAGNMLVADAGFEHAPAPTGGGSTAAAGEAWLYASGNVEYQVQSNGLIGDNANQYTDIHTNTLERFLQSMGILIFDPCPVTAVLAKYDTA